jgi:hypothetical protein
MARLSTISIMCGSWRCIGSCRCVGRVVVAGFWERDIRGQLYSKEMTRALRRDRDTKVTSLIPDLQGPDANPFTPVLYC